MGTLSSKSLISAKKISEERKMQKYDHILVSSQKAWIESYTFSASSFTRPDQLIKVVPMFQANGWKDKWPLHYAAMLGDRNRIISLLSLGRDPQEEMTDWYNSQALGWATSFGQTGAIVELLLAGADPDKVNLAGYSALGDARREGFFEIVRFFEEYSSFRRASHAEIFNKKMGEVDVKKINLSLEGFIVTKDEIDVKEMNLSSDGFKVTKDQIIFFRKYGFLVCKKVISSAKIAAAKAAAASLLEADAHEETRDVGVFGSLPEGFRQSWADCRNKELRALFSDPKNAALSKSMVGEYNFQAHVGIGSFTFAPRFRTWSKHPPGSARAKAEGTPLWAAFVRPVPPYDLTNLPRDLSSWSRNMLHDAAGLDINFAPCAKGNWHVDGYNFNLVAYFDLVWGAFISDLPKGNMGNLIVYPGSHHVVGAILRDQGARNSFYFDSRQQGGAGPPPQPDLTVPGVCDGKPYELLAEAGDVVLMHPFLAHGIGTNATDNPRLAVYCRLSANDHAQRRRSMKVPDRDELDAGTWLGDIFALQPGI